MAKNPVQHSKRGRVYLSSWFQRFVSIVLGSVDLRFMVKENVLATGASRGARDLLHGRYKTQKESITHFLQLGNIV